MKNILDNGLYTGDVKAVLLGLDLSFLKDKTILITGGLGLIGSSIVDIIHLSNIGTKVLVADINSDFYATRYGCCSDIEYVKYNAIEPITFEFKVDYIIHGAGISSPELYVSKPVETMLSNYNGVLNLLNYAKNTSVKRLLYISSSEVYGNKQNEDSFVENIFGSSNINTVRASYSEAKRASEVLCRSFTSEYGVDTVMVRPGHIYGPTASPNDKRIVSAFAFMAANGLPLEMKSSGLQRRSYCYSLDCASAILTVLRDGISGESYNIGHDSITSIKKMSEIVAKAGGVPLFSTEPSEGERLQFNPMNNSSLNNDKVKQLGYRDTFTVEEGLTHTVLIIKQLYS